MNGSSLSGVKNCTKGGTRAGCTNGRQPGHRSHRNKRKKIKRNGKNWGPGKMPNWYKRSLRDRLDSGKPVPRRHRPKPSVLDTTTSG